ncbi:hypothetical protein P879_05478 [Paragonimus westermani]|uniref:Mediator of RNA polymerase II transcription subunit 28 n=1 Tax=Paragonimus westermani TaxID=34504 RepID=A0A8T0D9E9_9TREM|nr:hypothetical protein P879_05478 [Paragonimus westermani]
MSSCRMEETDENGTLDGDVKIWANFEHQLNNMFLVLSATNASADSDATEARHGVNDIHMASLLEACRELDSWFVKKRLLLATQRPDLLLKDELDHLHSETLRKEKLVSETKAKVRQYTESIRIILDQITKDLPYQNNTHEFYE